MYDIIIMDAGVKFMSIESELFKKASVNFNKLEKYGFLKENDEYKYSKIFMNDKFRADISVDKLGNINGKIYDLEMEEEYTNFRIENVLGEFINTVKNEYMKILKDIKNKCFENKYFVFEQSNRIAELIKNRYEVLPEFLWDKFPDYAVFRNSRSGKWFGIIMSINKEKIISNESLNIEILNVKLDDKVEKYLNKKNIYPAYHLSKKNWITIILDDSLTDEEIMNLIDISYQNSNIQGEWIVPANPNYFDLIESFNNSSVVDWKQSNNILKGDIVYLYVARPYSAILYKCEAIETDIPYEYKDKNVSMKKIMKLKLLKKYDKDKFTLKKLNEYGIKSIRGPRGVSSRLREDLNKC